MRFSLILLFFQSVLYTHISAQQIADTLRLDDVEVQASRVYVANAYQPVSINSVDSLQIELQGAGDISKVLAAYAPVHVRTNGPGGLSTISQRGYTPSQTQILWNGFQLNHAMLGLTDLSLIPSFAVENIQIASGNGNTSFGDKGGGTVAIQTRKPANEVGISQSIGGFGQSVTESYAGINFGSWKLSLVTGMEDSENKFTYSVREFSNEAGGFVQVDKERANNRLQSKTGILSAEWKEGDQAFSTTVWAHDMTNEIPGAISGLTPQAYQEDEFLRWMSRYTTTVNQQKITGKLYYNRQQLDFINPASDINSLSTSSALIADVEVRSSIKPQLQLISAIQLGQNWVKASDYTGSPSRSQFTLQTNPIWHPVSPLHVYGGFRFDYYTDFKEAYSANVGVNVEVIQDQLFLKGQLSRNFVAPTFNDLYWPELGDPDLQPETNLKYEAGLLFEKKWSRLQNTIEFTLYDGNIENGIRWLPGAGGQTRPQNLESMRLWGFEVSEKVQYKQGDFRASLQSMLMHNLAELKKPRFEGDQAVGKQLRYTPKWQVKTSALLSWRTLSSAFTYSFTGQRFSTADHSSPFDPLSAYEYASWSSSYQFSIQSFQVRPQVNIQNLFDEEYSVIKDYPMPGRSLQIKLTVTYSFN